MGKTDVAVFLIQKGKCGSLQEQGDRAAGRAGRLQLGNHVPAEVWLSEEGEGGVSKQKEQNG